MGRKDIDLDLRVGPVALVVYRDDRNLVFARCQKNFGHPFRCGAARSGDPSIAQDERDVSNAHPVAIINICGEQNGRSANRHPKLGS